LEKVSFGIDTRNVDVVVLFDHDLVLAGGEGVSVGIDSDGKSGVGLWRRAESI
jgi:hypothetical protein